MTQSRRRPSPGRSAHRADWTIEIFELAAFFVAAGSAHLFEAGVQIHRYGSYVLMALGGALVVGGMWRRHRRPTASVPEQRAAEAELPAPSETSWTLWRLRVSVQDSPGRLAALAGALASIGGNIRTLHVHPTLDGAVDEVLVHVPDRMGRSELVHAMSRAGCGDVVAVHAGIHELADTATRALSLAAGMLDNRSELADALRGLLGDVDIQEEQGPVTGNGVGDDSLRVPAPGGGTLLVSRQDGSFTPAECARARAMARIAARSDRRPSPSQR